MPASDHFSKPNPTDEHKALVLRYIEDANNGGDVALVDELMAPGYVWHDGPPSRDELKRFIAWQRATAPDWRITIEDMVAEGDRVAVRASARGTRSEQSQGVAFPSPRYMELAWIAIYRIDAGQIAEVWVVTQERTPR